MGKTAALRSSARHNWYRFRVNSESSFKGPRPPPLDSGHLFDNLGGFRNRISTVGCGGGLLPLSGSFCAPFSPHTGSRIKLFIRYPVLAAVDLCTSQKHQRGASLMFAACAHWRDCSHNYVCTLATVNNSISVIVSARWVSTGRASLFDGVASRLSVHHERTGRWTSLFV